jgi:hypothetical protein
VACCEDRREKIPPRTVTDQYLARRGEHPDIVFEQQLIAQLTDASQALKTT